MSPLPCFLATFTATLALVPVVRWLARRYGVEAREAPDRWHTGTVPTMGGVALAAASLPIAWALTREPAVHALVACSAVMFGVGLADDLRPMRPLVKLAWQLVAAAGFLALAPPLPLTGTPALDGVLGVAWLVLITNSVNLLDNMDGLAAGVVAIASVGAALCFSGETAVLSDLRMLLAALAGAAAGFLAFNWHPASIFMGDAGSHLLGAGLGGAMWIAVSEAPALSRDNAGAVALALLAVPIADAAFVALTRLAAGRSPFAGGRDHASHRMVNLGLGQRGAGMVLYGLASAGGVAAWLLVRVPALGAVVAAGYLMATIAGAIWLSHARPGPAPRVRQTNAPSR
jgi:UDP-GlcNAc:undecaprenyl-phosphate/decaprenyl-phosphate GlcNAc-1-phosphate transferase